MSVHFISYRFTALQPILSKGLYPIPNICYHIYKVRRGSYNKIRLYLYFDGGTCRTRELFATNNDGELIEITGTNIEKVLNETTTEIEVKAINVCLFSYLLVFDLYLLNVLR